MVDDDTAARSEDRPVGGGKDVGMTLDVQPRRTRAASKPGDVRYSRRRRDRDADVTYTEVHRPTAPDHPGKRTGPNPQSWVRAIPMS